MDASLHARRRLAAVAVAGGGGRGQRRSPPPMRCASRWARSSGPSAAGRDSAHPHEPPAGMRLPVEVLVALCIAAGIAPMAA